MSGKLQALNREPTLTVRKGAMLENTEQGWWVITTTNGRYFVEAKDERTAEDTVIGDMEPGESVLDGMNDGPYRTHEEAENS